MASPGASHLSWGTQQLGLTGCPPRGLGGWQPQERWALCPLPGPGFPRREMQTRTHRDTGACICTHRDGRTDTVGETGELAQQAPASVATRHLAPTLHWSEPPEPPTSQVQGENAGPSCQSVTGGPVEGRRGGRWKDGQGQGPSLGKYKPRPVAPVWARPSESVRGQGRGGRSSAAAAQSLCAGPGDLWELPHPPPALRGAAGLLGPSLRGVCGPSAGLRSEAGGLTLDTAPRLSQPHRAGTVWAHVGFRAHGNPGASRFVPEQAENSAGPSTGVKGPRVSSVAGPCPRAPVVQAHACRGHVAVVLAEGARPGWVFRGRAQPPVPWPGSRPSPQATRAGRAERGCVQPPCGSPPGRRLTAAPWAAAPGPPARVDRPMLFPSYKPFYFRKPSKKYF